MEPIIPASEKAYDFFISYKSENIDVVRPLAEILIANHFKVWFSEYSLDISTYLGTDDGLRKATLMGISRSKYALCFTNEAYFSSERCRMELNGLLECLKPEDIIQVPLSVPAFYAQVSLSKTEIDEIREAKEKLKPSPYVEFESLSSTLKQIACLTKFEIDDSFPELGIEHTARRTHFSYNDNDFSVDFSGWRVYPRWTFATANGDVAGPTFERDFGHGRLSGHILVGPQDKNLTRTLSPEYNSRNKTPDRLYYRRAAEFAQVVIHGLWNRAFGNLRGQVIHGTHLLFLLGRSQMALTTFSGSKESILFGKGGMSNRLYSIVVPETSTDPDTELAFFFSFQGTFPEFCRCAPYMDQLVLSLQRESIVTEPTWRQYSNNLATWIRQPMLWVTAALLLAAGLTLPDLNTTLLGGASEVQSAFLLLIALALGSWSTLQSLRVRGLLWSLFLMAIMLVGGFLGSTVLFTLGDKLWGSVIGTKSALIPLILFGATILLLGNLIAFLLVTWSRRIQNVQIARRK